MNNNIPYGKQEITQKDIEAVNQVLRSNFLTQGPKVAEFEKKFADYIGCRYAVAVANGTAALHLSTLSLNVQPGQKVITTPITFSASANCVAYCGGEVIFVDIDPETYLIDINQVKNLLKTSGEEFVGIIPVDFTGRPVNMEKLYHVAREYNLWVIEDACHAPGGFFTDSKESKIVCGDGRYSDLSIFSFHPVKHIAAGEGGMVTTNNKELYQRLLELRTHGITKDENNYVNSVVEAGGSNGVYPNWYMEMQELGYNYRLTDIQSALGISQLERADNGLQKRRHIAARYYETFKDIPAVINQSGVHEGHAYHLYIIEVEKRLELYNYLRSHHIYTQVHYIPIHLMPYYKNFGWKYGDFPRAELYYSRCLSLPMYPSLTDGQQNFVIKKIIDFYSQ